MENKLSSLFNKIYEHKKWGSNNTPFYSGEGSDNSYLVSPYISLIQSFFKELSYKPNVIDVGCGDFNIGKELVPYTNKYVAVDIVDSLIKYNKNKYKDLNVQFKTLDITKSPIPTTDIIIVRQVFQHLSNEYILKSLKNIYLKSKYLIITEEIPNFNFTPNLNIESSPYLRLVINNSGVDILSPPFNFPIERKLHNLTIPNKYHPSFSTTSIYKQKLNN